MCSSSIRRVIRSLLLLAAAWQVVQGIVGGENAKEGEFPHQALLGYAVQHLSESEYQFQCGGSLISDQYVLTVAHCVSGLTPVIVRLGESNLKNDYDNQVDVDIQAIIKHEEYRYSRSYHDIALVKLKEKVRINDYIQPACLWRTPEFNSDTVIATGFGLFEPTGRSSDTLQKVQLDILDKSECIAMYASSRRFNQGVIDQQLCVGSKTGGKDTCQGDTGGPIQVIPSAGNCTYSIVGITSTGLSACGVGRSPAIYTRVSSYIDWIEKTISPSTLITGNRRGPIDL